ncbi:hypothetical protein B0A80_19675 [Flavobacterium tructae]|uniref:hypothetical protein n=1 Tax=Flavobacterium tructae TaxID=1114873 RepID=UPI000B5BD06B|nr:hypothetical protein [Flavobacterium tructae]OXB19575.1 hypothetical protein B0A80_19675 [Flavobacterium tructae]
MKKKISILLFMTVSFMTMYAQSEKDKYDAINTYLLQIVIDTSKTIVMVREKISTNEALRLFSGGKLSNVPFSRVNGTQERVGGILEPVYNEKYFQKMRKKYQDDRNEGRYGFAKKAKWNWNDFKLKNIHFEVFDSIMFKKGKALPLYKYETLLITLSEPMYYKNNDYLVIGIAVQESNPVYNLDYYVIVMKKIKNKWTVIEKGQPYQYY